MGKYIGAIEVSQGFFDIISRNLEQENSFRVSVMAAIKCLLVMRLKGEMRLGDHGLDLSPSKLIIYGFKALRYQEIMPFSRIVFQP